MTNQIDGVRVAVKDESEPSTETPKKTTGRTTRKKPVRRKTVRKKAATTEASKEKTVDEKILRDEKTDFKRPNGNRNNPLVIFLVIIITAAIVGGAIYTWQENTKEQELSEVEEESETVKESFEKELSRLKNKLLGTEKEKTKLEEERKRLAEKAMLLEGARLVYKNEELGISFDYPAAFGEVTAALVESNTGAMYVGGFKDNQNIEFSYLTSDYTSSSTNRFIAGFGFNEDDSNYYYLDIDNSELPVEPIKIMDGDDKEILVLDRVSFNDVLEESEENSVPVSVLSENELGVLINLNNESYPAFMMVVRDKNIFDLESLTSILETIK